MKLYKNHKSGLITIWCENTFLRKQYMYYSKREAIKKFKDEFGIRGKVTEVDWCLWAL